jgi:signal transduction histidine kinase
MTPEPGEKRSPLTPEILVPRLGDYLVERGLITSDDLLSALQKQAVLRKSAKEPPLLGQLLIELNLITRAELDAAITEHVLQLRNALQETNRQLELRVRDRTSELEKALQKLSELNQLKANFIANISHELRTPLTHLKGYQELIMSGDLGNLNPQQEGAIKTMQRAADKLGRLIEDLILFSTSERTQIPLQITPTDIAGLCKDLIEQFCPKIQDHRLTLEQKIPESTPKVFADQDKVGWVIYQLLDNAVKFTSAGGKISVKLIQDDLHVKVVISDTGIGISTNRLSELFEPFHQLDSSSTRKYGGTGLGLSLAKKIIEAHDSKIQVISEVGKGSQFSFSLKKYAEPSKEENQV